MLSGNIKIAILPCKFSDTQYQEPHSKKDIENFLITPGSGGMFDYWRDVSYGQITFVGSKIFNWINLPYASNTPKSRFDRIADAEKEASKQGYNPSSFFGVIVYCNTGADLGAIGSNRMIFDANSFENTFVAHEIGHLLGFDHSFNTDASSCSPGNDSRPGAYGNPYDIMSAKCFGHRNQIYNGVYGDSGPGLNSPNLDHFGWLPSSRILNLERYILTKSMRGIVEETINISIAALNLPQKKGYLVLKRNAYNKDIGEFTYYLEFRAKIGWDSGLRKNRVLIHQLRGNGLNYIFKELDANDEFNDEENKINIKVNEIDAKNFVANLTIKHEKEYFPAMPPMVLPLELDLSPEFFNNIVTDKYQNILDAKLGSINMELETLKNRLNVLERKL